MRGAPGRGEPTTPGTSATGSPGHRHRLPAVPDTDCCAPLLHDPGADPSPGPSLGAGAAAPHLRSLVPAEARRSSAVPPGPPPPPPPARRRPPPALPPPPLPASFPSFPSSQQLRVAVSQPLWAALAAPALVRAPGAPRLRPHPCEAATGPQVGAGQMEESGPPAPASTEQVLPRSAPLQRGLR